MSFKGVEFASLNFSKSKVDDRIDGIKSTDFLPAKERKCGFSGLGWRGSSPKMGWN